MRSQNEYFKEKKRNQKEESLKDDRGNTLKKGEPHKSNLFKNNGLVRGEGRVNNRMDGKSRYDTRGFKRYGAPSTFTQRMGGYV